MSEISGIKDEEIDVEKIMERIRENIKKRKSELSRDLGPQVIPTGDSQKVLSIDIDAEMNRDITFANQRYNTADLLMVSRFGKIAAILKKLVNRSIRFYTIRQTELNAAIVRLLNKFIEKVINLNSYLKDVTIGLGELKEETQKRHEELEKRLEEKAEAITREVSHQGSELSQRLEDLGKRLHSLDAEVQERVEALRIQGSEAQKRHEELEKSFEEKTEAINAEVQERVGALRIQGLEAQKRHEELEKSVEEKTGAITREFSQLASGLSRESQTLKQNVIFQERRLTMLLEEARRRLPKPFQEDQLTVFAGELERMNDLMYLQFEDQFRGTREDIKERVKVYLPIIREAKAGTEKRPILDLGCGRGEWLELLKDAGLKARGVDSNKAVVGMDQEMGLEVIQAELLAYLQSLKDKSLGAVTGFHISEHLPYEILLRVLEESVRVLKVGGVAIFETPNPKNILVGACDFYIDPSHRNPIHPDTLKFLAEAKGLVRADIIYVHPYKEENRLGPNGNPQLIERLNGLLYGPRDYVVVGYKA